MESQKLKRLSELTAISRERELTPSEKAEREVLRNEYREAVTGSLRRSLDSTVIVNPDGTRRKLKRSGGKG